MPLENYEGETFLAYLDISGFKNLMSNEDRAWRALDKFYNAGYTVIGVCNAFENIVDGLFISDCGVMYTKRDNVQPQNRLSNLRVLLQIVKDINSRMRDENIMLTTSIAYGRFRYQQRIELPGIEKHPVYGNAYVSAFIDNEKGRPSLLPGLCRILNRNLPEDIKEYIVTNETDEIFSLIEARRGDNKHLYYYWMLESPNEIDRFVNHYTDSERVLNEGRLRILKREIEPSGSQRP